MPGLVAVCDKETDTLYYMHSVDAAEATRLGDYVYVDDMDKRFDNEDRAVALARARGMGPPPHAELLSEEERQEARRQANETQVPMVSVPTGTPVVLQAGAAPAAASAPAAERQAERTARQARAEEKK